MHNFLKTEWSKKSKKNIELYVNLGEFINSQSPSNKKPIKGEIIQEEYFLNDDWIKKRMEAIFAGSQLSEGRWEPHCTNNINTKTCQY